MKAFLNTVFLSLFLSPVYTQSLLRFVGTSGVNERIGQEYTGYWNNRVAIEQQTQDFLYYGTERSYTIPLVFHFVLPASIQVTADQLNCQLSSLNEDFSGQTFAKGSAADLAESFYDSITLAGRLDMFSRAAENTGISFCVAQTDPQGNTSTGIDFANSLGKIWTWDDRVKRQGEGGLPAWDADKFLNIWVCQLADSVSGYAQMPGGPLQTDGIVIDYRFFGCGGSSQAPFNKGKTLTHLIGNYLNLYDLWSYSNRCQDDNVSDTPVHNAPNMGGDHFRHISTCDGQPMEMIMNFMDDMDDSCMYMFTKGQVKRMQAILAENGWRSNLSRWESTGIACSNAPFTGVMLQAPGTDDRNMEGETGVTAFSVVPNPAKTRVAVSLYAPVEQAGSIRITTSTGTEIYNSRHQFAKGANAVSVDCSNWPRGVYLVVLNTSSKPLSQVLIVD